MVRGLDTYSFGLRRRGNDALDLEALLHPAQAFNHPSDVVHDPDLTLSEKRAILASWASDACAVEAAPDLRRTPGGLVRFDDIMDALAALDGENARTRGAAVRRRGRLRWRRRSGEPPNDGHVFG
jgi:hypothetical protein